MFVRIGFGVLSALLFWSAAAQSESEPQILPQFVPDQLLVALNVDLAAPDTGRGPDDLYTAAGVIELLVPRPPGPVYLALLQAQPGTTFGQAFRTIQTFDFGTGTRWSLGSVTPNYFGCGIPEGCPGTLEVSQVYNLSTRAEVKTGENVVIGGLIIPGEFARLVVFKVRGPSLESFGLNAVLANPRVRLHQGQKVILENDDWGSLRPFELDLARNACPPPDDPREAMMVTYLDPGPYTAIVSGADGETGVALLEMYLVDAFRVESAVGP